jgi:hypothetical protein
MERVNRKLLEKHRMDEDFCYWYALLATSLYYEYTLPESSMNIIVIASGYNIV